MTTAAGSAISPAVEVAVQDAFGNTVTTAANLITVAIGANPGGGILSGTLSRNAVSGVATFSDLSINKAGIGYTLTATATDLAGTTTAAFNIIPGPASALLFTMSPGTNDKKIALLPAVQVSALDAFGNLATGFTGSVTVAIASSSAPTPTLAGTLTVAAVGGVASFSDLTLDKLGTYTLGASSSGLTGAASASFLINTPTVLVFIVQPTTTTANGVIAPAVQVAVQDGVGNTVLNHVTNIGLSITSLTGAPGATLNGTVTATTVMGVATFSNLSIDLAGAGYTLTAADLITRLKPGISAAFDIK